MITYTDTDLLSSPAQTLVNPVNTVGVMGKGLAAQFKQRYPVMFAEYRDIICQSGRFHPGSLWLYRQPGKWILNFATKRHWREPSRLAYITEGLASFLLLRMQYGIESVAFPCLGCGNGQLDWETQVQPIMESYLAPLPISVFIHVIHKVNANGQ